jgi:hypothetical protein
VLGDPVDLLVLREQLVEYGGRPGVPGPFGVVEERRAAPPAVGIGVLVLLGPEEQTPLHQLLHEPRVRVLHELSGVRSDALVELPVRLYGVDRGEAVAASEAGVVLAVGRGDVHQARALGRGDVLTEYHRPQVLVLFGPLHGHVVEGASIPQPFELRTLARL